MSSAVLLLPAVKAYSDREQESLEGLDLGTGFLLALLIIPVTLALGVVCCAFAMRRVGADRIVATVLAAMLFLALLSPVVANGPLPVILLWPAAATLLARMVVDAFPRAGPTDLGPSEHP